MTVMKEFGHFIVKVLLKISLRFFWVFPVNRERIFFINELSFTYGDSLKYVCEYIKSKNRNWQMVFALKDNSIKDNEVLKVKPYSIKYFYYLITSKVILTNAGGVSYIPLRKNQRVINTWHGGGPYKKTGTAVYDNFWYKKEIEMNARNVHYMLSSCGYFDMYEAVTMGIDKNKCIASGLPRNDIFFGQSRSTREKVFDKFKINKEKHLILYAPTFRSDVKSYTSDKEAYIVDLDTKKVCKMLGDKFGGSWVMGVRLHPKLTNNQLTIKDVINMSLYPDMQELLTAADVVISDYSSLIWDYSLTYRPCFIFAEDIYAYEKQRGFYMKVSEWPYPICVSQTELFEQIKKFDIEKYKKRVEKHHRDCTSYEKGEACSVALTVIDKCMKV